MVDFEKALQTGLAAHADADAKIREINEVIKTLSGQIPNATGGEIGIFIIESVREKVRQFKNAFAMPSEEVERVPYTLHDALSRRTSQLLSQIFGSRPLGIR
jgi:hypothetical protein